MAPKRQRDVDAGAISASTEESAKKLKFSTSSKPVTVIVGTDPEARNFYIHEDVLKRHSDFFAAALRNDWREAREGVIPLSEDDPETFEVFADFLYQGNLTIERGEGRKAFEEELGVFRRCWLLGDKILSQSFKDAIVDGISGSAIRHDRIPTELHNTVYAHTDVSIGLKCLLVDFAVFSWPPEAFRNSKHSDKVSVFFMETTLRAREISPAQRLGKKPWVDAGCKYHDHGEGKACYKAMF